MSVMIFPTRWGHPNVWRRGTPGQWWRRARCVAAPTVQAVANWSCMSVNSGRHICVLPCAPGTFITVTIQGWRSGEGQAAGWRLLKLLDG
jgi:hypothetical protein